MEGCLVPTLFFVCFVMSSVARNHSVTMRLATAVGATSLLRISERNLRTSLAPWWCKCQNAKMDKAANNSSDLLLFKRIFCRNSWVLGENRFPPSLFIMSSIDFSARSSFCCSLCSVLCSCVSTSGRKRTQVMPHKLPSSKNINNCVRPVPTLVVELVVRFPRRFFTLFDFGRRILSAVPQVALVFFPFFLV